MKFTLLFLLIILGINYSFSANRSVINSRIAANSAGHDTLIFDLSNQTVAGNRVQFPVSISSDEIINSMDFSFQFNEPKIHFDTIVVMDPTLNSSSQYTVSDQFLMFSSYSQPPIHNNIALISIGFNFIAGTKITPTDLRSTQGYLNGTQHSIKVITSVCERDSVLLSAPDDSGNTYLWSTGETTSSIYVKTHGTYFVRVTNNGVSFCTSLTTLIVNPLPNKHISANGPNTFCKGDSVVLNAAANAGNSYLWSTGQTGQSITANSNGNYFAHVTSQFGCSINSDSIVVTVNPLPDNHVSANGPTTFCQGDSVAFNASTGNTYLWSTGETSRSITAKSTGNYFVKITNLFNCSVTSPPLPVTVNPLPDNTVSVSAPTTLCSGDSLTLGATAIPPGNIYLWSSGETNRGIIVKNSGNYSVHITDTNGCSSTSTPIPVTFIVLPSDINKDGAVNVNDFLLLVGKYNSVCDCPEDINKDGIVNVDDFLLFVGDYNKTCR